VSAGPWRCVEGRTWRYLDDWTGLWAQDDLWFAWHRTSARLVAKGDAEGIAAAMEAADLWASENGYPAVRVDVDP
jgi:hypothetical protein